jgi:hypothetical protein
MESVFGQYPKIYVNRKSELFPLIEKYSGQSMKNMNHGQAISIYINLLKTNPEFVKEIDALVGNYHNAGAVLGTVLTGVMGLLGLGGSDADAQFAQVVLQEQKSKNTQTLLIVGGITLVALALLGVGIYVAVKKNQ